MSPAGKAPIDFSERHKYAASKEYEEEEGGPWLNLWVGNLSPETVDDDLMAIFVKFGALDSVTSYSPRTYAFVYFRTIKDAKAAKEALHGTLVRGRSVKIQFARPAKPGRTLWVGGIARSVAKEQLEDEFMKFGKIEEFKFLLHRGSAFIVFKNIEDAIAAQKSMNWKQLGGGEIRVDFQKLPPPRREWPVERDYRGSRNLLISESLSPDQMKYIHEYPQHGIKVHQSYVGRRDGQLSNVLWVGYPPDLPIDEELLHNSMILFGEIERIRSSASRHFCLVEFRSVDEARRAKEGLQGRLFGDSRIQILFFNGDHVPGCENPSLGEQEVFFSEPSIGPVELFGPGRSLGPGSKSFPGHLTPNSMPKAIVRPFTQGIDPHHGGSDFHEFSGGTHNFRDDIINNPISVNWNKLPTSTSGIMSSGRPGIHPPLRPLQGVWDDYSIREPKRTRLGIFPSEDPGFQGEIADGDDLLDLPPGVPRPDRILPMHSHQAPAIPGHDPSRTSPGTDYCWRGIIAKGGTPVCHARCLPVGNGLEVPFPEIVNCSARTGLDMLTTHYTEAIGFDMVYFLPDSEEDFASYTEFLRYLGERDRAGVAKFDDGTTMFLVPPSDFLTQVLKFSGPERLYGVVLKLPQQATTGQQLLEPPSEPMKHQQGHSSLRSYDFMAQNREQSLKVDYGSSSLERSISNADGRSRLVHSEEPNVITSSAQDYPKNNEAIPRTEVSLTPELIATLASLIPANTLPTTPLPVNIPSSSSGMSAAYSGPLINDNSMLVQGWGQNARGAFSGTSLEQMYNPMQNSTFPGHHYSSQAPLVPGFSTYGILNGQDNSFQSAMGGMQVQESSLNMQQASGALGTLSSQVGQFPTFQSSHSTDVATYNLPIHQQAIPATSAPGHNGNMLQMPAGIPRITDNRLNTDLPSQVQPLQMPISASGQGTSEGDADKDQRYQSTLQFAATLLRQIQQQQQANTQGALGSGNPQ